MYIYIYICIMRIITIVIVEKGHFLIYIYICFYKMKIQKYKKTQ